MSSGRTGVYKPLQLSCKSKTKPNTGLEGSGATRQSEGPPQTRHEPPTTIPELLAFFSLYHCLDKASPLRRNVGFCNFTRLFSSLLLLIYLPCYGHFYCHNCTNKVQAPPAILQVQDEAQHRARGLGGHPPVRRPSSGQT